jgi:hypothetical protein
MTVVTGAVDHGTDTKSIGQKLIDEIPQDRIIGSASVPTPCGGCFTPTVNVKATSSGSEPFGKVTCSFSFFHSVLMPHACLGSRAHLLRRLLRVVLRFRVPDFEIRQVRILPATHPAPCPTPARYFLPSHVFLPPVLPRSAISARSLSSSPRAWAAPCKR